MTADSKIEVQIKLSFSYTSKNDPIVKPSFGKFSSSKITYGDLPTFFFEQGTLPGPNDYFNLKTLLGDRWEERYRARFMEDDKNAELSIYDSFYSYDQFWCKVSRRYVEYNEDCSIRKVHLFVEPDPSFNFPVVQGKLSVHEELNLKGMNLTTAFTLSELSTENGLSPEASLAEYNRKQRKQVLNTIKLFAFIFSLFFILFFSYTILSDNYSFRIIRKEKDYYQDFHHIYKELPDTSNILAPYDTSSVSRIRRSTIELRKKKNDSLTKSSN